MYSSPYSPRSIFVKIYISKFAQIENETIAEHFIIAQRNIVTDLCTLKKQFKVAI